MATNASGNQTDSAQTWDTVDSGQSEDIDNSLTGQGTSDRETLDDIAQAQGDHVDRDEHGDRPDPATHTEGRGGDRPLADEGGEGEV